MPQQPQSPSVQPPPEEPLDFQADEGLDFQPDAGQPPSSSSGLTGQIADAFSRFGRDMWGAISTFIPGTEGAQRGGEALMHPLRTAKGIGAAHGAVWQKGVEAAQRGDYLTAGRHFADWAIPVLGPQLDELADKAQQGQWGEAVGGTAALATQVAGPKAIPRGRVGPLFKGSSNPQVRAAVQWGQREGIPVPAGVATDNSFVKIAQRTSENTIVGSVVGDAARQNLAESLTTKGRELAQRTSPAMTVPETAGAAVRTGIEGRIHTLKLEADTAYDTFRQAAASPANTRSVQVGTRTVQTPQGPLIQPVMRDVELPVDMRAIKAQLRPLRDDMKTWLQPAARNASQGYTAIDSIVTGPDYLPAASAERGLGGLKSLAREAASADLRDVNQSVAARATTLLQQEIDRVAGQVGPDVLRALREGRAAHAAKMDAAEVLGKLRDEPVQLFNQATYAGDAGIDQLRNVARLAPQEVAGVGRAYLEKLLDMATAEGGFDRARTLFAQWQKLGPQTKTILFRNPALVRDLDQFFLLAKRIADQPNPSMTAIVGHAIGQGAFVLTNPLAGTAYVLGTGALTKLLYSPRGVRLLTQAFQTPTFNRTMAASRTAALLKIAGEDVRLLTPTGTANREGEH